MDVNQTTFDTTSQLSLALSPLYPHVLRKRFMFAGYTYIYIYVLYILYIYIIIMYHTILYHIILQIKLI